MTFPSKLYSAFLLATFVLAACSSSNDLTKEKWTITVGSGGGFTGNSSGFTMIETGDVYLWSGKEGVHERTNKIGTVSVEKAHDYKIRLDSANIGAMNLNSPGNMSTFIELETNGHVDRITWGSTDHPGPPDALKNWYDDFMKACGGMQTQ